MGVLFYLLTERHKQEGAPLVNYRQCNYCFKCQGQQNENKTRAVTSIIGNFYSIISRLNES